MESPYVDGLVREEGSIFSDATLLRGQILTCSRANNGIIPAGRVAILLAEAQYVLRHVQTFIRYKSLIQVQEKCTDRKIIHFPIFLFLLLNVAVVAQWSK